MKKCYWRIIGITLLAFILSGTISFRNFSILSFIMTFAILEFILFLVINKLPDTLKIKNNSKKISKKEMIIYCLLIIIPIIISVIAYYPGIIVPDSISSWNQAHLNNYNNWHPIFYSIIFFRIPTLIFDNVISCTIFQDLIIFSILLYFCIFLRKNYLGFKETILVLLLLIFNPIVLKDFAFLIKDILG